MSRSMIKQQNSGATAHVVLYTPPNLQTYMVKGIGCVFKQKNILWMKTNHYPNKITFHLVTVVPMTSFTLKSTSKLRSFCTLDIR